MVVANALAALRRSMRIGVHDWFSQGASEVYITAGGFTHFRGEKDVILAKFVARWPPSRWSGRFHHRAQGCTGNSGARLAGNTVTRTSRWETAILFEGIPRHRIWSRQPAEGERLPQRGRSSLGAPIEVAWRPVEVFNGLRHRRDAMPK
jgi:hypothetical protein